MAAIKAHFDGRVFVPDEPVSLPAGERVVVQRTEAATSGVIRRAGTSFLRKLSIDLDESALREIVEDRELSIENL